MEGKADTQESVRSFAAYLRSIPVVANINDELSRAQEADGAFNTHEDARENEIKEMKQGMKVLSKKVKQAQEASKRPATEPTTEEHLAALAALEEDYRSLVKANVSEDAALARAQEQARRLHEEISSLEQSNAADEHPVESPPLKLEILRNLGFEPLQDKSGHINKIIVRSASGEMHSVDIDYSTLSDEDLTDRLWTLASS